MIVPKTIKKVFALYLPLLPKTLRNTFFQFNIPAINKLINATPEVYVDQALFKPPLIGREKPWHQDHAFFDLPFGTKIIGC